MNKIGIHYGYWNKNWNVELPEYIKKAARLGFDVLEVDIGAIVGLSKIERENLKKLSEREDIELTYCTGLTKEFDISSENKEIRKKGIKFLKRIIKIIHEMGGEVFSGILYAGWNNLPEIEIDDKTLYINRSIESIKEVIIIAEKYDVTCNVEVVNRFEQFILNTSKEAVDYISKINSPNLKILLDTYHMNIEEDNLKDAIITAGSDLGHFHIGENNRKPPGQGGHLNWGSIIQGLRKINYQGRIVMEPFIQMGGEIGRDIRVWRDMSVNIELDREAEKALEFIKTKLNE